MLSLRPRGWVPRRAGTEEAMLKLVEKEGWSRTLDSRGDDGSAGCCEQ